MEPFKFNNVNHEVVLILFSILIGLIIGTEREYQNKSAGLRTFVLVSFGSCIYTILSYKIGMSTADRIASNIVTGIGFLGAGVIFKDESKISGINTATTIWATASLGMSIGSDHIYLALFGTFLVLVILRLLSFLQDYIDRHHKISDYKLVTCSEEEYKLCMSLFENFHLKSQVVKQDYSNGQLATTWRLTGNIVNHQEFTKKLRSDDKIVAYHF
ncbi:MAG: magnesium transporter MgtC [Pseudopedobacter saltans]|uniref:Magnesium transporter MgtC n=1 Tax=Pseudopedobacter saltans TaxID=151895 RepID=A0A2W5ETM6_9SPHI|nr:MAG: magnesium transporter MgtC [Pseudopedobacter saltans]